MTIYYIRKGAEGPIKIGFTAGQVERRMAQLQTGHHEPLILLGTSPGTIEDEKSIHRELKDFHIHGEWFRPEPALLFTIDEMVRARAHWFHIKTIKVRVLEAECAFLRKQLKALEEQNALLQEAFAREITPLRKKVRDLQKQLAELQPVGTGGGRNKQGSTPPAALPLVTFAKADHLT